MNINTCKLTALCCKLVASLSSFDAYECRINGQPEQCRAVWLRALPVV